jgi:hypothetical protein
MTKLIMLAGLVAVGCAGRPCGVNWCFEDELCASISWDGRKPHLECVIECSGHDDCDEGSGCMCRSGSCFCVEYEYLPRTTGDGGATQSR